MEKVSGEIIRDRRRSATGWPLLFLSLLAISAILFAWRAIVSATLDFQAGLISRPLFTLCAAALWVIASIGALHNGRRMRKISGTAWIINIVCAGIGFFQPQLFSRVNPWFEAGSTYFYLPTIAACLAVAWIMWSRPAHHALRNY